MTTAKRQRAKSGSPYEGRYGFSRAVRVGDRILVAGTAPIEADGGCADSPEGQARRCFTIISEAIEELGGSMRDLVRTRMYITMPNIAEPVGAVHREMCGEAAPPATMVVVEGLLDSRWLVEIEAEAILETNP